MSEQEIFMEFFAVVELEIGEGFEGAYLIVKKHNLELKFEFQYTDMNGIHKTIPFVRPNVKSYLKEGAEELFSKKEGCNKFVFSIVPPDLYSIEYYCDEQVSKGILLNNYDTLIKRLLDNNKIDSCDVFINITRTDYKSISSFSINKQNVQGFIDLPLESNDSILIDDIYNNSEGFYGHWNKLLITYSSKGYYSLDFSFDNKLDE